MTKKAMHAMAASPAMAPMMGPMRDGVELLSLSSSPFPAPMSKPILTQLAEGHWQILVMTSAVQRKPVAQVDEHAKGLHVGLEQVGDVDVVPAGCDISVSRGGDRRVW
jgi:hypothetical protein